MPVAMTSMLSACFSRLVAHGMQDINAAMMLKCTQMACRAARASMIKRFAPPVVAQQIIAEFWRIEKERAQRQGPAA